MVSKVPNYILLKIKKKKYLSKCLQFFIFYKYLLQCLQVKMTARHDHQGRGNYKMAADWEYYKFDLLHTFHF